ncbi:MAG: virulence factor [Actinomycetota bacterium]
MNDPDDAAVTDVGDTATGDALDQGELRERRTTERSGRGGRRRGGAQLSIISWRGIPAQLTARTVDGEQHKVLLHARFQHAIDRAAAVAGLTSTHDYVQEWVSTPEPLPDVDIQAHLDQRCAEVEGAFPRDRLEGFVANGGLDPDLGVDGRASS